MNAHRLELVAKKLDENPPFDFTIWIGQTWKGAEDLSCGATACALGWAATIPELYEAGLRIAGVPMRRYADADVGACGYITYVGSETLPSAAWSSSIAAACAVFDLTVQEAEFLFQPGSREYGMMTCTATAAQVAAHIRAFIQRGGGMP